MIQLVIRTFLTHFRKELSALSHIPLPEVLDFSSSFRVNHDIYPFLNTEIEYETMEEAHQDINSFLCRVSEQLGLGKEEICLLPIIFAILTFLFLMMSFGEQPIRKDIWSSYIKCFSSSLKPIDINLEFSQSDAIIVIFSLISTFS